VLLAFKAFQAVEQSFMKLPDAVVAGAAGAAGVVVTVVAALVIGAVAAAPGATHFAATNCFHVMPVGTVLLAFMAFQAVEQSFMKLPDAVAAGVAGAVTTGATAVVVAFAGFAAGAAAGAAGTAAAASVPHWALRKSFHFKPPSVPAAFAALNLALHSVIDRAEAWLVIISGVTPTIKVMAKLTLRNVLDMILSCVEPQTIRGLVKRKE